MNQRIIPQKYTFFYEHALENGPNIMREAFRSYGIQEIVGEKHSQEILDMASYLGGVVEDFYTADEIPWCGLAVSYWIKKAGFKPPKDYSQVRARDFLNWGKKAKEPKFGDILVFWRGSRQGKQGHVGLYVAEDQNAYFVLGGNQSNMVCITRISKSRFIEARRCPWRWLKPRGVKKFLLQGYEGDGYSINEA